MSKFASVALLTALFAVAVLSQKQFRPWGEWSQKDALKILEDSPWGQTQTETDTSIFFSAPAESNRRMGGGSTNQEINLNFRIRFFTAKPIRQALVRIMEIQQKNLPSETSDRLTKFANLRSDQWVILTLNFDSTNERYSIEVMQALGRVTTELIKSQTYLERKDGKRAYLNQYVAPGKDGFGARFIFPRQFEGEPFLSPKSGEVRFHSELLVGAKSVTFDRRFKTADMVYNGELEY
jgi:hypothetical protein